MTLCSHQNQSVKAEKNQTAPRGRRKIAKVLRVLYDDPATAYASTDGSVVVKLPAEAV
jgi:hypothetical protein